MSLLFKRLIGSDNNLAVMLPKIAKEWHPSKNKRPATEVAPNQAKSLVVMFQGS